MEKLGIFVLLIVPIMWVVIGLFAAGAVLFPLLICFALVYILFCCVINPICHLIRSIPIIGFLLNAFVSITIGLFCFGLMVIVVLNYVCITFKCIGL